MSSAALLFSFSSALIKGFGTEISAMELVFIRSLVGIVLMAIAHTTGAMRVSFGTHFPRLLLRGLFGTAGLITSLWAIQHMELGLSNALNKTSPIFTAIFAGLFLGERFGPKTYLLILSAFAGALLIIAPDFSSLRSEALVALLSGAFAGAAYTTIRSLRKAEAPQTIVLWFLLVGLVTSPFDAIRTPWLLPETFDLSMLCVAGLFAFAAQILMTRAYAHAPATLISPFFYLSTVAAILLGLLWGEFPTERELLGCAIVIISAIGINQINHRKAKNTVNT